MGEQRSWTCTFVVQVSLCVALYLTLKLGQPQNLIFKNRNSSFTLLDDVYFISVRGGFRTHQQQIRLLKQMENVAKLYNATFVVNISELGEDDPLTKNANEVFSSLNVPWYGTRSSKGERVDSFMKKIVITHGKTLNVLGVNTATLQDLIEVGSTCGSGNSQSNWLSQRLEAVAGNWIIVVGYDPVVDCEENTKQMKAKLVHEPIQHVFTKYGVNAYLSRGSCTYASRDGVAYIGLPDPANAELYVASSNRRLVLQSFSEMADGFLLHRVNSQKMTTYFVSSAGKFANGRQM